MSLDVRFARYKCKIVFQVIHLWTLKLRERTSVLTTPQSLDVSKADIQFRIHSAKECEHEHSIPLFILSSQQLFFISSFSIEFLVLHMHQANWQKVVTRTNMEVDFVSFLNWNTETDSDKVWVSSTYEAR